MFNLIIIDDEVNIREGISCYISSKHPDIKVTGCFEDGADAIDFLKENDVNIVITDVKMLTVSGIEVAEFVYKCMPGTKVIILSGYREFEYARKAISYNVRHYLMKPTDFSELSSVLCETVEELSRDELRKKHVSYFEKYAPMLKEELLTDLLMGAIRDRNMLETRFELLETGMSADRCSFSVINLSTVNYSDYLRSGWMYGKEQLNEAIKNFVESLNTEKTHLFHVQGDNGNARLIGICPMDNADRVRDAVSAHLDSVVQCAKENLRICFEYKIETVYPSVDSFLHPKIQDEDREMFEEQIRLLVSHINLGNISSIESIVDNFTEQLPMTEAVVIRSKGFSVIKTVAQRMDKDSLVLSCEEEISSINTRGEMRDYLKRKFIEMARMIEDDADEQRVIERAKEFIQSNFKSDISLVDVAAHVFLNPAYFSRYFKQYMGMNFTTYLLETRMNHAKKLLSEGKTLEEVAAACGYSSGRYFAQSFKKHTGVTPKSYRLR